MFYFKDILLEGSSCLYIFIISVCLLGRRFFNLHSVSSNAVAESINVLNNALSSAISTAQSTANSAQSTANSAWNARWNSLLFYENDGNSVHVSEAILFYGAGNRYSVKFVAFTSVTATNSWWGFDPAPGDNKIMIGLFRP